MFTYIFSFYLIFPEDGLFKLKHVWECLPCIRLEWYEWQA